MPLAAQSGSSPRHCVGLRLRPEASAHHVVASDAATLLIVAAPVVYAAPPPAAQSRKCGLRKSLTGAAVVESKRWLRRKRGLSRVYSLRIHTLHWRLFSLQRYKVPHQGSGGAIRLHWLAAYDLVNVYRACNGYAVQGCCRWWMGQDRTGLAAASTTSSLRRRSTSSHATTCRCFTSIG
jgi:hypothetical protein